MAYENYAGISPLPFQAGAAIGQYRAVKQGTTAHQVIATTAITDVVMGVAQISAAAAEDQVPVQIGGVAKMVAGAAIALGAQVMPQASGAGKVITAAGATAVSCGVALEAAAADGDIIPVRLIPNASGPANS
jgi:hypothetical protein